MKIRTSPTSVQVQGPLIGYRRQLAQFHRPQCFTQIWRDCNDGSVYYVFHDGSIYQYLTPAVDDATSVILADVHGQRFDLGIRRAAQQAATFNRVTSIPGTAALIYNPPPYAGVDPGPCVAGIDFLWTLRIDTFFGPDNNWTPGDGITTSAVTLNVNPVWLGGTSVYQIQGMRYPDGSTSSFHCAGNWFSPSGIGGISYFHVYVITASGGFFDFDLLASGPGLFNVLFPLDTTPPGPQPNYIFFEIHQTGPGGSIVMTADMS